MSLQQVPASPLCHCCFEDIPAADNPTLICLKCGTVNRPQASEEIIAKHPKLKQAPVLLLWIVIPAAILIATVYLGTRRAENRPAIGSR
jgi:hypothetical protein